MSINYDLYQNPPRNGNADKGLHPRAVNHGTLSTKELAERINKSSSFTQGDVLGLLSLLSDEIVNAFNESKSISIDGLGIFAVSLQSRPVSEAKEIHSQSIEVKNITFRASNQLKSRVCKLSIERDKNHKSGRLLSDEERRSNILAFLESEETINQSHAMNMNHCSLEKARKDITELIEEGKVVANNFGMRTVYKLVK